MSEFPTLQNGRQIQPDKSEADPGPLGSLPFWPDPAKMDLSWLSDPGFEQAGPKNIYVLTKCWNKIQSLKSPSTVYSSTSLYFFSIFSHKL